MAQDTTLPRPIRWRRIAEPGDRSRIAGLLKAGGMAGSEAAALADMVTTTLDGSDTYRFLFAEGRDGALLGYACYDRAPASKVSWEIHGIGVSPEFAESGLVSELFDRTLSLARQKRGTQVFAELGSGPGFAAMRAFYENYGFDEAARFGDFYDEGEDKLVLRMAL